MYAILGIFFATKNNSLASYRIIILKCVLIWCGPHQTNLQGVPGQVRNSLNCFPPVFCLSNMLIPSIMKKEIVKIDERTAAFFHLNYN